MNKLHQYSQEGELYLWRCKKNKNFPGYQMSWSKTGRESILNFLDLLSGSDAGEFRTLRAFAPTDAVLAVPNNRKSEIYSIEKIRIENSREVDWSFTVEGSSCDIKVSPKLAHEWAESIRLVKSQVEISFNGIYFWW